MFLLRYRLILVSLGREEERPGFHDCLGRGMLEPSFPNKCKHISPLLSVQRCVDRFKRVPDSLKLSRHRHTVWPPLGHHNLCIPRDLWLQVFHLQQNPEPSQAGCGSAYIGSLIAMFKGIQIHEGSISLSLDYCLAQLPTNMLTAFTM